MFPSANFNPILKIYTKFRISCRYSSSLHTRKTLMLLSIINHPFAPCLAGRKKSNDATQCLGETGRW